MKIALNYDIMYVKSICEVHNLDGLFRYILYHMPRKFDTDLKIKSHLVSLTNAYQITECILKKNNYFLQPLLGVYLVSSLDLCLGIDIKSKTEIDKECLRVFKENVNFDITSLIPKLNTVYEKMNLITTDSDISTEPLWVKVMDSANQTARISEYWLDLLDLSDDTSTTLEVKFKNIMDDLDSWESKIHAFKFDFISRKNQIRQEMEFIINKKL